VLELGGKCPVYIDRSLTLTKCCRRLAFGKFINAGQSCAAPDYCLVHEEVWDAFKAEMLKVLREFYGDVAQYSENVAHLVSGAHYDRIVHAIDTSRGNVIAAGFRDRNRLYIGPTLVESPSLDSRIMTEEIFGPVLPLLRVPGPREAIEFINRREKPLAIYVMTDEGGVVDLIAQKTSSGAVLRNDTTFHISSPYTPFGGVGNSGMGQYHGKHGIRALSHMKPIVSHSTLVDFDVRYPPYTPGHLAFARRFA
jgi:aldehyde dehydrogenase (NAD+)